MSDVPFVFRRKEVVDPSQGIHGVYDEDILRFHSSIKAGSMNHFCGEDLPQMSDVELSGRSYSRRRNLFSTTLHEPLCGVIRPVHVPPQTVAALISALNGTPSTSSSQDLFTRTIHILTSAPAAARPAAVFRMVVPEEYTSSTMIILLPSMLA